MDKGEEQWEKERKTRYMNKHEEEKEEEEEE